MSGSTPRPSPRQGRRQAQACSRLQAALHHKRVSNNTNNGSSMHTLFDRNLPALLLLLLLLESTDPRSLRASGSTTAPSASAPQSQPATIPTRQQKTRRRLLSAAAGETGGLAVTAGWGTASRALEQHCMSGARLELGIDLWVGSGKKKSTPIEPAGATLLGKRWARRQRRKAGHESGKDTSVGMVDWRRAFARGKHAVSTRPARGQHAVSTRPARGQHAIDWPARAG